MGEATQVEQIRAWLAGELYPEHDTFTMSRGFAEAVIATDDRWTELRRLLEERFTMARGVLDANGHDASAVLVPIEEVLIWMRDLEETDRAR